ncbi:hypothetical protein BH11PLA2_BH11PLA2_07350 [soil metagenome]
MMRSLRLLSIAIAVTFAVTACQQAPGSSTSASSKSKKEAKAASENEIAAKTVSTALTALQDGQSADDTFTADFKQLIAPPVSDEDKQAGYSKTSWSEYCLTFKGQLPEINELGNIVDTVRNGQRQTFQFDDRKKSGSKFVFFQIEGAGIDSKISWFQASRVCWTGLSEKESPQIPWTCHAFLSALVNSQDQFAIGLMSPSLRASLAPVFSKADETRGYNPGTLIEKLKALRGNAKAFGLISVEGDIVKGQLVSPADVKKSFTLKLSNGPRGLERIVDSFTVE